MEKVVELIGGESVINGAYPVQFFFTVHRMFWLRKIEKNPTYFDLKNTKHN